MRFKINSAPLLVTLLLLVVTLVGCQRQRAENSLKKTTQKLSNIEQNYNGLEHRPDKIKNIRDQIDSATALLQTDAGSALTTANAASTAADQLLEEVKPIHADEKFSEAMEEIRIADINDLTRLDRERYQRIIGLKTEAETARSENNWDNVIQLSEQIISEVRTGLSTLQNEADRKQIDAEQALTQLKAEGGNIYAPEVVIGVQTDIDVAKKVSEEDRDYVLAANKFAAAKSKAESGIVQVLRRKSQESIDKIEGYIATALIEGAKQFKNDEYEKVNALYVNVLQNFADGQYRSVIEATKVLERDAQILVVETKRAASDDRIQTMQANITELEQGGILEYLPTSLDRMRELLTQSQTIRREDTEEAFDRIKTISIQATDEYDRQRGNFQTLAQDAIRDSKNTLDRTRAVFNEMDNIFDPIEGQMTPSQVAFENQKRARQSEIRQRIEEATSNLATADLRSQNGRFREAIILAGEVKDLAEATLGEIYHTVAHNAVIELANLISRYERDGAREYAAEELRRATTQLEEVKSLIAQGANDPSLYKTAVEQASETRADVELMAQAIAGRATVDLREARRTLTSATSDTTRRFRADMLQEVEQLIVQAEKDLQENRLKIALETAKRATNLALQAQSEANQLAAEENIAQATNALTEAQTAGAELYAGREMEDARRLLSSARGLYDNRDYVKAQELAESSESRAINALYKKINEADTAIATAKAIGAWDYDYNRLASANTKVSQARQRMESDQYSSSADLADQSASIARELVRDTKAHNFDTRADRIKENLAKGSEQGLNFFQPEESIEIRRELADLENDYSADDYERVMTRVSLLEAKLRTTLDRTDVLVIEVANQLDERLNELENAGATEYAAVEIADARQRLQYARLDYNRGLYKAAHSSLDRAIRLTREVEAREAHTMYSRNVQQLFDEYQEVQAGFANVLSLEPNELKQLSVRPGGAAQSLAIAGNITPREFRAAVDELYSRALLVQVPPGLEKLHESVISAFAEGRLAATHFEKLVILNRVSVPEGAQLIDEAYRRINTSNRMITAIQSQLIADEIQLRLVQNNSGSLVNSAN